MKEWEQTLRARQVCNLRRLLFWTAVAGLLWILNFILLPLVRHL